MNKKFLVILISLFILCSISSVSASEKIYATPSDDFTYYGYDQPAAETHSFAIEVDSGVYYINDNIARKLATYSSNFGQAYNEASGRYLEGIYDIDNDKSFYFEYVSGQQVGFNNNAKVITKIYDSDGQEII